MLTEIRYKKNTKAMAYKTRNSQAEAYVPLNKNRKNPLNGEDHSSPQIEQHEIVTHAKIKNFFSNMWYVWVFAAGVLTYGVGNGWINSVVKAPDLSNAISKQEITNIELKNDINSVAKSVDNHSKILNDLVVFSNDMRSSIGRIEGSLQRNAVQPPVVQHGKPQN